MTMSDQFKKIYQEIERDPSNESMRAQGFLPLYTAGAKAKIVIIGQAPGLRAQRLMRPWQDASGDKLRDWLGVSDEQFFDPDLISLLPMDFYFPGKGPHGDLPPRRGFAERWHPQLLALMPAVKLTILIGNYAQKHYLGNNAKANLTETVRNYQDYLPQYFPLVHPSPLNFRWQAKNPWFTHDVVPVLRATVKNIVQDK